MNWGFVAKLLFTLALLGAVFIRIDLSKLAPYLSAIEFIPVMAGLGLAIAQVPLTSLRWHLMLRTLGIRLPIWITIEVNILSIFANSMLVNVVGGIVTRVGFLLKHDVPSHSILSTSLLERILIASVLAAMTLLGFYWADIHFQVDYGRLALLITGGALAAASLMWLLTRLSHRLRNYLGRVVTTLVRIMHDIRLMSVDARGLSVAILLTLVSQVLMVAIGVVVGYALDVKVPLLQIAMILPGITLVATLPVSVGGFGLREVTSVTLLGLFGVAPEQALVFSVMIGVLSLAGSAISYAGILLLRVAQRRIDDQETGALVAAPAIMSHPPKHGEPTVTHVITSLGSGGAERMLTRLVTAPSAAGVRHRVVSLMGNGVHAPTIRAAGIPLTELGLRPRQYNPLVLARIIAELRTHPTDIVMTWLYHADLLGTLATRFVRKPRLIWNLRCSDMDLRHYPFLTRVSVRALARLSSIPDVIVSNSEAGLRHHRRLGYRLHDPMVIGNGFNMDELCPDAEDRARVRAELGIPDDGIAVVLVARTDPMKDHPSFLRAAGAALAADDRLHFILIGRGTDAPNWNMLPLIQKCGITSRLQRLGERPDIYRLLRGMDAAVSSSTFGEGFSNAVGEAMATALPCIATDVGDSARLIGKCGLVVPPHDPNALAGAILELAALPRQAREDLGRAARARILSEFSLPAICRQYDELFIRMSGHSQPASEGPVHETTH